MSTAELSLRHHSDPNDDAVDAALSSRGCCFPSTWWHPIPCSGAGTSTGGEESWWFRGWKKIRDWSEIVCGPKWKTFIRRFGKNRVVGKGGKFQYDPLSYALNFDDGPENTSTGLLDEDSLIRNFSYRFASIPASANNSAEIGRSGLVFDRTV